MHLGVVPAGLLSHPEQTSSPTEVQPKWLFGTKAHACHSVCTKCVVACLRTLTQGRSVVSDKENGAVTTHAA